MSGLGGHDRNLHDLRLRRVAAEAANRDEARRRFDVREAAKGGREVDLTDVSGQVVRIERELREWVVCNPELSAELLTFERQHA